MASKKARLKGARTKGHRGSIYRDADGISKERLEELYERSMAGRFHIDPRILMQARRTWGF